MAAPGTPDGFDEDEPRAASGGKILEAVLAAGAAGRLDRALADALPQLSRARLRALMEAGAVTRDGAAVTDPSGRAASGTYRVAVPAPAAALPEPQDIPLEILFEDADLIVVDKPAGMAVHPGPGVPDGTLVNALLHHCGASLSGIGGVARPGVVHRLDKDTSGVMVAAKTDAAHRGLAALFAAHDIERSYIALVRGAPRPPAGEIRTRIGRSTHDRMKMAVLKTGGREAVTHYRTERTFGPPGAPLAARLVCRLETGRTHQIRVHMASLGSPCLGDPVYGSGAPAAAVREALRESGLARQALHAAVLGFVHPVTGERLRFESTPPPDMAALEARLSDL
ncbi:MAG: RluA family pseudouridine synthase [Phenylobacterium sp.]|uniref:RluA family pseudouridine synthase n=2 Tax=Phenylobacterium sp. TaxID=1871053 RepID=UPI0025EEC2F9|nr:RluA family pseudouridine synthase [Phenylobacterium sp.]MCA3711061.1 RluA family pseudouridine synthase [Phenylobacterium sp.]MCA3724755.1 RluA family pseudouridine synthase [Phenylobacterium sp.]MCA3727106.1 RluA family pseudouridine synthase [Phenylobacterium sp.]MCA6239701.1 RluA family pseudouridine synthase [Phenylobacterium sp.]